MPTNFCNYWDFFPIKNTGHTKYLIQSVDMDPPWRYLGIDSSGQKKKKKKDEEEQTNKALKYPYLFWNKSN